MVLALSLGWPPIKMICVGSDNNSEHVFCRTEQKSYVSPFSPHTTDRTRNVKPGIGRLKLNDVVINDLRKAATMAASLLKSQLFLISGQWKKSTNCPIECWVY
jgi:hypothetical protein